MRKISEIKDSELPPITPDNLELGYRVERFRGYSFIADAFCCTSCNYNVLDLDQMKRHLAKYPKGTKHPWTVVPGKAKDPNAIPFVTPESQMGSSSGEVTEKE